MSGLYIHIPFCRRKCIYCDFYSLGARNAPWREFVDALLSEFSVRRGEFINDSGGVGFSTLYIGGGTPSLIPSQEWERLVAGLRHDVDFGMIEEFTFEVNPDDVTAELVARLRGAGVNRVSMGIQSFDDGELRRLGRRHTARQAEEAYRLLGEIGNVSIDLMFGLPGQTLDSWRSTLDRALDLRPEHISAYTLMWEEGTALSVMRRQGRIDEMPEGLNIAMYQLLTEKLRSAGYEHYEISNYALPGFHSRHNSSYWTGSPYLGLGPGAHSYDGVRTRRANPVDLSGYVKHFRDGGGTPFFEEERLSDEELREEMIMTGLRMARGIDLHEFRERFGGASEERLLRQAAMHLRSGNLTKSAASLSLTEQGMFLLDAITVDLM